MMCGTVEVTKTQKAADMGVCTFEGLHDVVCDVASVHIALVHQIIQFALQFNISPVANEH